MDHTQCLGSEITLQEGKFCDTQGGLLFLSPFLSSPQFQFLITRSAKIPQEANMSKKWGCISRKKGVVPQGNAVYTLRALRFPV